MQEGGELFGREAEAPLPKPLRGGVEESEEVGGGEEEGKRWWGGVLSSLMMLREEAAEEEAGPRGDAGGGRVGEEGKELAHLPLHPVQKLRLLPQARHRSDPTTQGYHRLPIGGGDEREGRRLSSVRRHPSVNCAQ